jgi:hypothetical protein
MCREVDDAIDGLLEDESQEEVQITFSFQMNERLEPQESVDSEEDKNKTI